MSAQDAATTEKLPFDVKELTPEWFSAALSIDSPGTEVAAVEVSHIIWGTATKVLVRLDYAARPADGPPERLCVKGCFDTALLELGMGPAYSAEAHFYASVAPATAIPAPRSWYARTNPDQQQGILVLDDLAATGCSFGDPTEPWHPDRVAAGLEVLAGLHAATAGALTVEDRRAQERALLDHYREALTAAGSTPTSPDQMWQDYRRQHLHGFLWSLTGPRMQPRERVFAMSERHVAAIEDHETLALLT